ncbi:DUF2859 domain-containing protein [Ottowia sp.]|uniref:DUF2859 domain-containing protein n=1 Tax=Ottowia sp. TaxID=1898956 RepID=UPI003A86D4EC
MPPSLDTIDAGPAVPMSVYTAHLVAGADQAGVIESMRFPLRSRLVVGRLAHPVRVLDPKWLTQPMALLGADPMSQNWLEIHLPALRARRRGTGTGRGFASGLQAHATRRRWTAHRARA